MCRLWHTIPRRLQVRSAGGGFLLKDKNPVETAGVINRVVTDEALRTQIIKNQQARLADFDHKVIEAQFKTYLDTFINGGRKG